MSRKWIYIAALAVMWGTVLPAQRPPITQQDKNNQTLFVPKDPPLVAVGETSRLMFHVSPLSGQGLLSQQTRDALKAILKLNGGAPIVHIRAFSAGNGDIRRIPQIVSDVLGDKHGPLPSVSVLQAGALTVGDAQIVLETISVGKKEVNKDGLTFHLAEAAVASDPAAPIKPLLQTALDQLAAKMNGKPALSVTCLVSILDGASELMSMVTSRFAGAATNLVQPRRLAFQTEASCEGVSRGGSLTTPRMAFSGTQVSFGVEEKDAALAVQRLDRALTEAGARSAGNAALVRFYLLSPTLAAVALKQLGGSAPTALFSVEGVGAASAGFAVDAVAPVR
jgi:hypothetical protein